MLPTFSHRTVDFIVHRRLRCVAILIVCFPLLLAAAPGFAAGAEANWPNWRGPQANGTAPTADPPVAWSETENVKWKVKLPGRGTATPIVWENQIFIQTAIAAPKRAEAAAEASEACGPLLVAADPPPAAPPANPPGQRRGGARGPGGGRSEKPTDPQQFALVCLDRATGKTLWQKIARDEVPHEGHHPDHGFSSSSPLTDGTHVFAYYGSRGLHCYDREGNLKWQKDLGRMTTKNSFGEGSSPALSGNTIVINWDHEGEDFIVALNKETGEELWRQPRKEETSWATPLIVRHGDQTQVVTAATGKIRSYDLATGKLLWECGGLTANVIPTPVTGHGMVYITSGFRGYALLAIRLGRSGDLTGTDAIAWSHAKSTPYVPSPLLVDHRLYFFGGNNGILSCFEARTGRVLLDAERIGGLQGVYASPVAAAGKVYLVGRNGTTVVIKQSDKLEIMATNRLEEKFDASPALAGKDLFLRGQEYLYCLSGN